MWQFYHNTPPFWQLHHSKPSKSQNTLVSQLMKTKPYEELLVLGGLSEGMGLHWRRMPVVLSQHAKIMHE
jgi:hypothetical protein